MTSPLEAKKTSIKNLQRILERKHGRPFTYDEAERIGQGLTRFVTTLAKVNADRFNPSSKSANIRVDTSSEKAGKQGTNM
jgi:hypothetical protein